MQVTTIGLDLAKNVFQVHGVDDDGNVTVRRKLGRSSLLPFFSKLPPCIVGIEACATAHYWARMLLAIGHQVKLMPPAYVKPYVKRGKNDATDAEAICEAVMRPSMRFVAVKSAEQQSILMLHRCRDLLIRQRTMLANALRSHFAELGVVVAQGIRNLAKLTEIIGDAPAVRDVVKLLTIGVTSQDSVANAGTAGAAGYIGDVLWNISGLHDQVRRFIPHNDLIKDFTLNLGSAFIESTGQVEPVAQIESRVFTDRFRLRAQLPLSEAAGKRAEVEYQLDDHLSVQGEWNNDYSDYNIGDFGVDLRARWEFGE